MTSTQQGYIPGVCNIGRAEIRQRKLLGWLGLVVTVALWAILMFAHVAPEWRLVLFIPAAMGMAGFLQAAWHFCARFGLGGVFNFGPEVGRTDTVEQAEFRRLDRQKALRIIGLSVLAGVAVAAAAYLSPL
jgi:hypothetical protein